MQVISVHGDALVYLLRALGGDLKVGFSRIANTWTTIKGNQLDMNQLRHQLGNTNQPYLTCLCRGLRKRSGVFWAVTVHQSIHSQIDRHIAFYVDITLLYLSVSDMTLGCMLAQLDDSGRNEEFIAMTSLSGWRMYFDGAANHSVEYEACILGLETTLELGIRQMEVFGDSNLIEPPADRVMREVHTEFASTHGGHMLAQCQIHGDLIHAPPSELHALTSPWPFSVWVGGSCIIWRLTSTRVSFHQVTHHLSLWVPHELFQIEGSYTLFSSVWYEVVFQLDKDGSLRVALESRFLRQSGSARFDPA
ncbi:hypothetical protein CK203_019623 [Vitis vinifera]|uniref:RNase H type-1 domain-containing protein n=1 Tax=Vitis vinifera TaxID=29760 RepID=A0A438JR07_VITVI|nr:hypothetical protein CK203_019623 [Vitis vinifera]